MILKRKRQNLIFFLFNGIKIKSKKIFFEKSELSETVKIPLITKSINGLKFLHLLIFLPASHPTQTLFFKLLHLLAFFFSQLFRSFDSEKIKRSASIHQDHQTNIRVALQVLPLCNFPKSPEYSLSTFLASIEDVRNLCSALLSLNCVSRVANKFSVSSRICCFSR